MSLPVSGPLSSLTSPVWCGPEFGESRRSGGVRAPTAPVGLTR
jgi:hypothetical protein